MSNPFDGMGGMGGLAGMFSGLQAKMEEMKKKASETVVIGESGGGIVKVHMTGAMDCVKVELAAGTTDDRELLEDLLVAAITDANAKARDALGKGVSDLAGGLPLPPGLFGR